MIEHIVYTENDQARRSTCHCYTLQRTAMHCNALQYTTTHCNILPCNTQEHSSLLQQHSLLMHTVCNREKWSEKDNKREREEQRDTFYRLHSQTLSIDCALINTKGWL